jgi:hypothetical protein
VDLAGRGEDGGVAPSGDDAADPQALERLGIMCLILGLLVIVRDMMMMMMMMMMMLMPTSHRCEPRRSW